MCVMFLWMTVSKIFAQIEDDIFSRDANPFPAKFLPNVGFDRRSPVFPVWESLVQFDRKKTLYPKIGQQRNPPPTEHLKICQVALAE